MRALITGAAGFVGRRLTHRLTGGAEVLGAPLNELVLVDLKADLKAGATAAASSSPCSQRPMNRWLAGNLTDPDLLGAAVSEPIDYVFHLASVPGGAAEADFDAGMRANLDGTRMLLDALRRLPKPPVVVFASTIGLFGTPLPAVLDEDSLPAPTMSYGAQKWIGEILVADCTRRGFIDGRAVRLPGIVARPPAASGMLSAFLSDILRELSAGRSFVCPVAPEGKSWWMSVECCIDNLLHAARLTPHPADLRRVWQLPVLHASLGEVVAALAAQHGPEVLERVRYEPNAKLQAQFANLPPLSCPRALAAGFRHDGDLSRMIERALVEDV